MQGDANFRKQDSDSKYPIVSLIVVASSKQDFEIQLKHLEADLRYPLNINTSLEHNTEKKLQNSLKTFGKQT